jgi:GrpB-like predicted nucleotidyltransferase (UPF0157 family)
MHDPEYARRVLGGVALSPADASWPACFLSERERLKPILGSLADALEHYGSTAVPGLMAKPIIDMMAPVRSLAQADRLGDSLAATGYLKIDAGFFKRRFFRRKTHVANLAYHLHLVVFPAWPIKNELLLRDWLIQHPQVARAYETLKIDLASRYGDDMPRYTQGKTTFLRAVVNEARLSQGLPAEHDWDE